MKNKLRFLLLIVLPLLFSCSQPVKSNSGGSKSDQFNQIVDQYFEANLRLNPLFATSIGDHRFDDQLTIPITANFREIERLLNESALAQAKALGCGGLDEETTLTCQTFTLDLQNNLDLGKVDLGHLLVFDQFDSFFSDFAELASGSSYVTFDTLKDYENFTKRMKIAPAYIDAMIENLKEGLAKKVTTPRALVLKAHHQLKVLIPANFRKNVFAKPLKHLSHLTKNAAREKVKQEYVRTIQTSIYPAYRKLEQFIRTVYLPATRTTSGLVDVPGGNAYYAELAKVNTTTDLTPAQIHSLGLTEVARIRAELEQVKESQHFSGSLPEFFQSFRKNPKLFPFKTDQEVLTAYQNIYTRVQKAIPAHFRLLTQEKFEIREVEKFKAATASEAYQNGTVDGTRPGIFWVPIPNAKKYGSKDMESLFLHEAIPGHHFQISIQQELTLPRYRRYYQNNAYVEGWALYAESLGKDLGMYTDPNQWVGSLSNEMHRAIRLVVDTGIHAMGWSREKAIAYSLENEPGDEAGITSEIERYMAIPGQALSYKLGEIKIRELKAFAKTRLGERYTDADFHDEILKDGCLPLSVLDKKVRKWTRSSH